VPRIEIDLNPVSHITTDAIGQPGKRVFYIQGRKNEQVVTLIVEKVQIQTLALGMEEFLSEISTRFPETPTASGEYDETVMHIYPPVDPLFRVGELALAYDSDSDLAILIAKEVVSSDAFDQDQDEVEEEAEVEGEEAEAEEEDDDSNVVRFWCTRTQLYAMCRWGLEVSGRGRPVCPYCGQPMEPSGHFCPKRNGHKH
jgi:uncharacterized repeat protein (TIGR03847 family)